MASGRDLKRVTRARLRTVRILMDNKDWDMAGYIMGYVLECALKAAVCRTLKQKEYPDNIKRDDKMRNFFQSHDFERLLMISGMSDVFVLKRGSQKVWDNWSQFTFHYQSNWTEIRYKPGYWNETTIKNLYTRLIEIPHGILNQFIKHKRW